MPRDLKKMPLESKEDLTLDKEINLLCFIPQKLYLLVSVIQKRWQMSW